MNRLPWVAAVLASLALLWRESCENPAVFCYLIGAGIFATVRARIWRSADPGDLVSCSNPSATSFTPSMMSRE